MFTIDAHEDLAYESLYGKFDYTLPNADIRRYYSGPERFQPINSVCSLRKGHIGIVIGTIFLSPPDETGHAEAGHVVGETTYDSPESYHRAVTCQMDFYRRWEEKYPELFKVIRSQADFDSVREAWSDEGTEHPVGILNSLEGAEGLRSFEDLERYYEAGLRLIGPVWGGGRWCSGTRSKGTDEGLSADGKQLLRKMESLGYGLDISHMKNRSAMDAISAYGGTVIASHANCNALLKGIPVERHLNDETIRMLAEHDGVMGVIAANSFLDLRWWADNTLPRETCTLEALANHIDHICQLTGASDHAAIGTDADGGFGYPAVPYEINEISDISKLEDVLRRRGYTTEDIGKIFHRNWERVLARILH